MFPPHRYSKSFRHCVISIALSVAIFGSSAPITFDGSRANAQSAGQTVYQRAMPPVPNLPNINAALAEGNKKQRTRPQQPPLKPSTLCGFRDKVCKKLKDKEKTGLLQGVPSTIDKRVAMQTGRDRGWLGRIGRILSGAFSFGLGGSSLSAQELASFLAPIDNADTSHRPEASESADGSVSSSMMLTPPVFTSLVEAKLDPHNRTGSPGEDLFSGNYNWSLPLVSLPGRSGLDLDIRLSYNSLVWIRYLDRMSFDYDYYPTLTPGFRVGFPEIDGPYVVHGYDTYVVILPSGRRVEMRKVATNKYEAIDSSYLYLNHNPAAQTMTLFTTDGTQFIYTIPPNDVWYRCTKIRDRNGNYITVNYTTLGTYPDTLVTIGSITDTLGRVMDFNYDANLHLQTITQTRQNQTFTWAQFDYGTLTVQTNFGSLYVDGPANGAQIPVITRVITGDGARHTFVYNSWGQVDDIWRYGEADNQRMAMDYAFPGTGTALGDCPRFFQRNDYIANWWQGWVSSYFYFDPNETFSQVTTPDNVTYKEIYSTTGGTRGLATRTETHYGGSIQKYTEQTWISDSASSPPLRPRVSDLKVCDDVNHNGTYQSGTDRLNRTTIDYITLAGSVRVPWIVTEYNEGGQSVLRSTQTEYQASSNYTGTTRRIIGLPSARFWYNGSGTLVAKTDYSYDSPNEPGSTFLQAHSSSPAQHDGVNYGVGFLYRGNLTKSRRYSVVNGTASAPLERKTGYYITGTPALAKDEMNHTNSILYNDSFSDDTPPQPTFAYPTKLTDGDGFSSTARYSYHFGAVTETVDPKSYAANPTNPPAKVVNTYDYRDRLEKSAIWKEGAEYSYRRFYYSNDHNLVMTYATINSLSVETFSQSWLDGADREWLAISEHPGSVGGLRSFYRVFDYFGRVLEWSRPTEINGYWQPTGDDTGYVYSQQAYDWKGRPTITTHPDSTQRQISYTGCGCAGGDSLELTDEVGRKMKIYHDILGRVVKSEDMNPDQTVYSTTTTTFNTLDQQTEIRKYVGTNGTSQASIMSYDGYGRLWKRKNPAESGDTVFTYQTNNQLLTVTDARGAGATYSYNNRNLVTGINFTESGGATTTPDLTFLYDGGGNRTRMTESGVGQIDYHYDSLSRLEKAGQTHYKFRNHWG